MAKRIILATLAIFVAWSVLDLVIHSVILSSSYEATDQLWRPMEEMKMWLIHLVSIISAFVFVLLYVRLVDDKSLCKAVELGILLGIAFGIGMGFGTYAVMPTTPGIALGWFLGTIVEMVVAGLLVGWIIREGPAPTTES